MFYARIKDNDGVNQQILYWTHEAYHNDTFSPDSETYCIIPFSITGKSYAERKECLRDIAIEFQYDEGESVDIGLSWGELWHIQDWFYRMGRKYGLLREFRENAIC